MRILLLAGLLSATAASAADLDVIVKLNPNANRSAIQAFAAPAKPLGGDWYQVKGSNLSDIQVAAIKASPAVQYVQPNYKIKLMHDFRATDPKLRAQVEKAVKNNPELIRPFADNPPIPDISTQKNGPDPLYSNQWGMKDIGVAGSMHSTGKLIVAVIDTGVDYTHEDLAANMWKNKGEMGADAQGKDKATNGVDDDGNGYIDDLVGWDFVKNDSKPYDLAVSQWMLLLGGGNPGHGTHCAGNVGARSDNGIGIRGVAGDVQIMALRFLSERGMGDTAGAIKAIRYGVDNGAKILSNSWGSEGEDPNQGTQNEALREAIRYANSKGVLFIAAAGNGHMGKGYDNDIDDRPSYPASYNIENIVSVAALDATDRLGKFSNWGKKTVHIGAPGVAVYSTVPSKLKYTGFAVNVLFGLIKATWDGTSMATPHVAGAAALYWAKYPTKTVAEVKAALLSSVKKIDSLNGKVSTDGKLNVTSLLQVK